MEGVWVIVAATSHGREPRVDSSLVLSGAQGSKEQLERSAPETQLSLGQSLPLVLILVKPDFLFP